MGNALIIITGVGALVLAFAAWVLWVEIHTNDSSTSSERLTVTIVAVGITIIVVLLALIYFLRPKAKVS